MCLATTFSASEQGRNQHRASQNDRVNSKEVQSFQVKISSGLRNAAESSQATRPVERVLRRAAISTFS